MGGTQMGGNYYNRIFADPKNVDRVYVADVNLQVTDDGGKTFHRVGEQWKHVDNHVVVIDPDNTDHLIVGCDGGVYETYDRGATLALHSANLPVTQYYRVATDNSRPFYNVYGGAQDNFSVGGPSRTRTDNGITQRRLVHHVRRRRLWLRRRSRGPEHRLRRVAVRRAGALQSPHGRSHRYPAVRPDTATGAPLELGLAALREPAHPQPHLLRREPSLPQRRPRRHLEARSARISRVKSTATSSS